MDIQNRLAQRFAGSITPSDNEQMRAAASLLAQVESELSVAVNELCDQHGQAGPPVMDADDRVHELLSAADAGTDGGFAEWVVENSELDNAEAATRYLGIGSDSDEWDTKKREWFAGYESIEKVPTDGHTADTVPGPTLDRVADIHTQSTFGVSLQQFETAVVDFDRTGEIKRILLGPMRQRIDAIEAVTDSHVSPEDE